MAYKVRHDMDGNYRVVELIHNENKIKDDEEVEFYEKDVFNGKLSDCESFIRLNDAGYLS